MEPPTEQADEPAAPPPVATLELQPAGAAEPQTGLGITEFVVAPPTTVAPVYHSWVDGWAPERPPDWIDIMLRPRRTIRRIIDEDPGKHVYLIAVLRGILGGVTITIGGGSVTLAGGAQHGPQWALVVGALVGIAILYTLGGLLRLAAWILGGEATFKETRTLFAWSWIPGVIGAIPLRVIDGVSLLLMGGVYAVAPPHPVLDPIASVVTYLVYVLTIWEIVILVLCMAEVHRFGITRAVLAVLLGVLIPLAAIGIPVLGFTLLGLR